MSKFQLMELNLKLMSWLGIHSYRLKEPINEFFHSFFTYFNLVHAIIFVIISSVWFAMTNISQAGIMLEACMIAIAGLQYSGMFLSIGLKMKKVKSLHLKLQEIVDEGDSIFDFFFI